MRLGGARGWIWTSSGPYLFDGLVSLAQIHTKYRYVKNSPEPSRLKSSAPTCMKTCC